MRIRRAIIIPVILAFGVAGSALSGSAISAATVGAPMIHLQVTDHHTFIHTYYHN
jgi:hypothetical protein